MLFHLLRNLIEKERGKNKRKISFHANATTLFNLLVRPEKWSLGRSGVPYSRCSDPSASLKV